MYLFRTYIRGTVCLGASCLTVSKPSSMGLSARGYRLFIRLRTYFLGTARVGCSLFIWFLSLPPGNCQPGWSLFMWFPHLPPEDCRQGVQLFFLLIPNLHQGRGFIFTVSKPSSRYCRLGVLTWY